MKTFSLLSLAVVVMVAGLLVGCDQGAAQNTDAAALAELQNQITQLQTELSDATTEITTLKTQIAQLSETGGNGSTAGGSGGVNLKIGFVTAEEVFVKFSGTEAAIEQYSTEKNGIEQELRDLQDQAAAGTMSQQEFLTKRQELEIRLAELDQQLTTEITEKIVQTVQDLGDEQGFDLITRRNNVVLYYPEEGGIVQDLTEQVLERMNAAADTDQETEE